MKKVKITFLMILFSFSTTFPSFATSLYNFGDGVNLQPSYFCNGDMDLGWNLMKKYDKIKSVRIEMDPVKVFEDFSQSYGGFGCPGYDWGFDDGKYSETAWIEDGKLIVYETGGTASSYFDAWIDCSDPDTYTYYPASGTSDYFDEFTTSIDTYWLDGNANRYGIYVCMQGNYHNIPSIWFWLWGDTSFTIGKYTGDWIYEEIVSWTSSGDLIHSKGEKNTLKITKQGNLFTFFINDHEVHSQQISGFPGGGIGISYADSMKIGFDTSILHIRE